MAATQSALIRSFSPSRNPANKAEQNESFRLHPSHPHLLKTRFEPESDVSLKISEPGRTGKLFDEIPLRSAFSYNSLIQRHLNDGDPTHTIPAIFDHMLARGVRPDKHTIPRILTASCLVGSFSYAKSIHGHAIKFGFAADDFVVTSLMTMYGQFDGPETAKRVFDKMSNKNSVSWTLLARLYAMENQYESALQVFYEMVSSGTNIDSVALVSAIKACWRLKSASHGRKVHEIARKVGLEFDLLVGNALLKMHFDFGNTEEARSIFDGMPQRDTVSWTTIISGCVQNGGFNESFKLLRLMCAERIKADSFAVASILPACARLSARKHGKEIHGHIVRHAIDLNLTVHNALEDMYMKSGCVRSASAIFERMTEKDVVSWTVMILGYSLHGQGEVGIQLFHEMEALKIEPDEMSYTAVLHACQTARKVEEGRFYFNYIRHPKVEHFASMVSLLARAGQLTEAQAFIEKYQIERHTQVQRALLEGCRIHQNLVIGKRVAERLTELEPLNADNYVVLSNVYAATGKWNMVNRLRETIIDMGLMTRKAYSWIEIRNKVHVFGVGDVAHPKSERIYWELEGWMKKMAEEEGCEPNSDFSFHDVDEERECIPHGHGEMLAVALGLISTESKVSVCVTKNMQVCRNCHTCIKYLSKMTKRHIVLKDPNRFHHFNNGSCSCGDFW
ncbi:pentatricopeptide repeat-containing protein DOT4, chloroplastic-like [Aristolochia californica]|uniref:pentatricopeptide repeat-containing protein DOT4, chloroplastic-like n=1 Tax=Aristolochia californica TaxID=171875 RepID=UPI0035D634E1